MPALWTTSSGAQFAYFTGTKVQILTQNILATIIRSGGSEEMLALEHFLATGSIRQHTSAYVSIRQHTSAWTVSMRQHTSAYVSMDRQHASAYVSIRPSRCRRWSTCSRDSRCSVYLLYSYKSTSSHAKCLLARLKGLLLHADTAAESHNPAEVCVGGHALGGGEVKRCSGAKVCQHTSAYVSIHAAAAAAAPKVILAKSNP
jgi:hypothetical protein